MRVLSTKVDDATYKRFKEEADKRGSYPSLLIRDFVFQFLHKATFGDKGIPKEDQKKPKIDKGKQKTKTVIKSKQKAKKVKKSLTKRQILQKYKDANPTLTEKELIEYIEETNPKWEEQ